MKASLKLLQAAFLAPVASAAFFAPPYSQIFGIDNVAATNLDLDSELGVNSFIGSNPRIKAYNFSVPVDHFHNESKYEPHSDDFYPLRYWLDTSNYRPGGPVIVLHSGEFDSEGRYMYLDHGIVPILTKATGGVGLVMEHRYYGTSWPVNDTSTENLRFLTTAQAMADTAYFAKHITFPGLEHLNLTSPGTPWILYGGSYAGGFVAFMRKIYPDVYWGAISSSGVTAAITSFWQYNEAFRNFAPEGCSDAQQALTQIVDAALFSDDRAVATTFKTMFRLADLEDDEFAHVLTQALGALQATNWAVEDDNEILGYYCAAITSTAHLFASTGHLRADARRFAALAGNRGDLLDKRTAQLLNLAGFVRAADQRRKAADCKGKTNAECYSPRNYPDETVISNNMYRPWLWQTCTEWGYFQNGEDTPKDRLPISSRKLTVDFSMVNCRRFFNLTGKPNTDLVNQYGGFNISYPRLAIIDGKQDPWRAACPHADGQPDRESTVEEPYLLIDWGVHHWDEFGLREDAEKGLPPKQVIDNQKQQVDFVKAWLKQWDDEHKKKAVQEEEPYSLEL